MYLFYAKSQSSKIKRICPDPEGIEHMIIELATDGR